MGSTLATRKQSAAIRQRMQEIRSELPYDVDDARQRVKQLSDWKYHMARRSVPILAAAVVAGYLIVPAKRSAATVAINSEAVATPAKRGLLSGIAGAAATLLMRHAASIAANQIANHLGASSRPQRHEPS